MSTFVEGDRRAALRAAKLAALVRARPDVPPDAAAVTEPAAYPGGAALVVRPTGDGSAIGWVYADDRPLRALGGALAWAQQHDLAGLHLVVDDAGVAAHLARRAGYFTVAVHVWWIDDRTLRPAVAVAAPASPVLPEGLAPFVELIRTAGADPVVEHGVLAGEVYGLEVCRVVFGDGAFGERIDAVAGPPRLEVGVGAADREAFRVMHGDAPTVAQLMDLVHRVSAHRGPHAEPHALNRLGAERRLRQRMLDDPSLIGARTLVAAPPPLPRENLKDPVPCIAHGVDADGTPLVVACAGGVDLDAVPVGADARAIHEAATGHPARLVIATAERDAHPALARLAAALVEPAELRTV